jgi:hypothetical protein
MSDGRAQPSVPSDAELIGYFGVRPKYSDGPSIPSFYQELEFETRRGAYIVTCRIAAASGDLALSIVRDSEALVSLEVSSVVEYRIEREGNEPALVAAFSEASGIRPLVLRLGAVPHVEWGTFTGWAERPPT